MKLGAYTACLHDKPVAEALQTLRELGLDSAEINSGGFLPPVHLPIDDLRSSPDARDEYLGQFADGLHTMRVLAAVAASAGAGGATVAVPETPGRTEP